MLKRVICLIVLLCCFASFQFAMAQQLLLECGDVVEDEFTSLEQAITYNIPLRAGMQLNLQGQAIGDRLGFTILLYNPANQYVALSSDLYYLTPDSQPFLDTGILSANGTYTILLYNAQAVHVNGGVEFRDRNGIGSVGVFNLSVACFDNMGEIVVRTDETNSAQSTVDADPPFVEFGFPGTAAQNFSVGLRSHCKWGA